MNKLPLTAYDLMKKVRPEMWDFLDQDLHALKQSRRENPIFSVDEIGGGHLGDCFTFLVEKEIEDTAERAGLPVDTVKENAANSPELLNRLKLLQSSINYDYHAYLNFELYGRKTFYFSDNITDRLVATELELDPSFLRPPFSSCQYVFTANSIIETAYDIFGPQDGLPKGNGVLSAFVTYYPDRKTKNGVEFNNLFMAIYYWEGSQPVFFVKREVALFPGGNIEKALKTQWEDILNDADLGNGFHLAANGEDLSSKSEDIFTDGLQLFRAILNATLYLSSSSPDITERLSGRNKSLEHAGKIESHAKAKKAQKDAKRESELDFASVGESIEPILIGPQSGESNNGNRSRQNKTLYRYIVRGHWRNQAYGEGRSKRKLLWIQPFYKGPEMSEVVNRPYFAR